MNKLLKELEDILEYNFKDKTLLNKALTHKSYNNKTNNEKLEFLGDRVLGLIISKKLLDKYPEEKEGIIDKKFANLVNKKTCIEIAKKLNIRKYLFLGAPHKNLERSADKIISDCLEAIVGAIYFDGGLKSAEKFVLYCWESYIDKSIITLIDSKTKLQEYSLKKFKKLPTYVLLKTSGPHHKPLFKVKVKTPDSKKEITGTGHSKKQAQQDAAKKMIIELKL